MSHPIRIGVRFPSWCSYGPGVIAGILDHARSAGLNWRIVWENRSQGELEPVRIDSSWNGDGMVLFRSDEAELAECLERGRAVVLLSSEGPQGSYPRISPDNERVGEMAADHLLGLDVPSFAFLGRDQTHYPGGLHASGQRRYSRERAAGFVSAVKQAGHPVLVHQLAGRNLGDQQAWAQIEAEVTTFLDQLPRLCCLFVADDSLGAVVLEAARHAGIQVPTELAVLGFGNDLDYCLTSWPPLSSIAYPGRAIGRLAAVALERQLAGDPPQPGRERVPPQAVVPRESTDLIATDDPVLQDLLRWLRRNAPNDTIRVTELAERGHWSLTTLKERFHAHLGRGPKEEILRIRRNHFCHLLRATDLSVAEISRSMGFASPHEASRFFQRQLGCAASEWRDQQRVSR